MESSKGFFPDFLSRLCFPDLAFQILMLDKPIHCQLLRRFRFLICGAPRQCWRPRPKISSARWVSGCHVWGSSTVDGETNIWRWQPTTWHVFQKLVKPGKSWDNFTVSTGADGLFFHQQYGGVIMTLLSWFKVEFYTKRWNLFLTRYPRNIWNSNIFWMLNVTLKTPCEVVFKFRKLFEHLNNTTH